MKDDNLIEFVISRIIRNAPEYHLKIDGDPSQKYFILRSAHLAPCFSTDSCDILFKFDADQRMAIFFQEHIRINSETCPYVCSLFLEKNTTMRGWQQVCPHLTERVYDVCFEYLPVLIQFVQDPILCGIHGCDQQVAHEKLRADFGYEAPGDKKNSKYEDDIEEHDKEK